MRATSIAMLMGGLALAAASAAASLPRAAYVGGSGAAASSGPAADPGDPPTLLNQPESVVYDDVRDCYLVSNYGDGNIVRIEGGQPQSYFNTELSRATGLLIRDELLYAVTNAEPYTGLAAFDLASGAMVDFLPLAGTRLLNDVTADRDGNFYITDYYDHKIYKVPPTLDRYWLYVNFGAGMPNGIAYDEANDRLLALMVAQANYPIRAIDLADSSHAVAIYTQVSGMDGIAIDGEGCVYFSSWTSNAVHRYLPGLQPPHTVFSMGHAGPADICYNPHLNVIAVPSFNRNTVEFVPIDASGAPELDCPARLLPARAASPASAIDLTYELPEPADVRVEIVDLLGRTLTTAGRARQEAGRHDIAWRPAGIGPGVYFYRIRTGAREARGRLVLTGPAHP